MKFNESGPIVQTQRQKPKVKKGPVAGGMRGLILSAVTRKDYWRQLLTIYQDMLLVIAGFFCWFSKNTDFFTPTNFLHQKVITFFLSYLFQVLDHVHCIWQLDLDFS